MNTSRRFLIAVALLGAVLGGCGGGRQEWAGQNVSAGGINIQVVSAYVTGPRLFVRTMFTNQSPAPIVINRDAIVAVLPNGQAVPRSAGTYGLHVPFMVPPGGMHEINVDFREMGFRWRDFPSAAVNWSNAVTLNGAPIALPMTPLMGGH